MSECVGKKNGVSENMYLRKDSQENKRDEEDEKLIAAKI